MFRGTIATPPPAGTRSPAFGVPVLAAATRLGPRALGAGLERADVFDEADARGIYDLCVLVTQVVLVQVAFVVANLW
ncbi:hypothetical protein [Natrinema ejinorense]|uniref:Uncharacterized protein n=1 Tax=Natrinema ejinorense TaxID=373386 RepID=A0A2A5R020_9EURY|nr:hypothetical protein [Natrinema ejinorense]PCR92436.1 hypothetical protein CP557_19015 [Natrinema ejinorense]